MTTFIVNGKEKELTYNVNGIDISGDFIGNTAHNMDCDEEGNYIATEEDFEWWQNTIANYEKMDAVIARYEQDFDTDEVRQVVEDWASGDYETDPGQVIMGLEKAFGKLE